MYVQYHRAGQQLQGPVYAELALEKRQAPNRLPGPAPDNDADPFPLTGPITITIINTRPSLPTPTIESISLPVLTLGSTSIPTSLPLSTVAPTSASLTTSAPTLQPSTGTSTSLTETTSSPTPTNPDNGTALGNNAAATSAGIGGGVVAGIVISSLFLIGVVAFFVWRARARKRRRKNRGIWTKSKMLSMPAPISNKDIRNEKDIYQFSIPAMDEKRTAAQTKQGSPRQSPKRVPVPQVDPQERPQSDAFDSGLTSPFLSTFSSGTVLSGPYGSISQTLFSPPRPQALSPFSAKVISTFITTLPDELDISLDEIIRVVAEYDDGWALCMNANGVQGMVPLECLDRGDSGVNVTRRSTMTSGSSPPASLAYLTIPELPPLQRRGSKRLSSLDPTAQPVKTYPRTD